jgi:hypothetical protein
MADQTDLIENEVFEIADKFSEASAELLDFRVRKRDSLSPEEEKELEKCEDRLDKMVVGFRDYGIRLIGAKVGYAVAELKGAIDAARSTIEEVANIKKAIQVATALVDLAVALMSKDPKAILNAASAVQKATEKSET